MAVDVQSGNGQGTLPWQPILGTKSVEIGETPTLTVAFLDRFPAKVPQNLKSNNEFVGSQNCTTLSPILPPPTKKNPISEA